jgi:hypothetical protein
VTRAILFLRVVAAAAFAVFLWRAYEVLMIEGRF